MTRCRVVCERCGADADEVKRAWDLERVVRALCGASPSYVYVGHEHENTDGYWSHYPYPNTYVGGYNESLRCPASNSTGGHQWKVVQDDEIAPEKHDEVSSEQILHEVRRMLRLMEKQVFSDEEKKKEDAL